MNVKRIFNFGMVVMMLVTSFAVYQPVAAEAPMKFTPRVAPGAQTMPGEVVVAFTGSQDKNLVEKIEQAVETANTAGGEVTRLSLDGGAVIRVDGDTNTALAELNEQPDVLYAEPNYIYSVPTGQGTSTEYSTSSEYVFQNVTPSANTNWMDTMAVPNSTIQSMVAMGTYPTDTYLTNNQGWFSVGANIVWPNTTVSANICQIDTGVDSVHPDLSTTGTARVGRRLVTVVVSNILMGYDFVNADTISSDDNGHGTHVAGIMVASKNNAKGISGISTGKVVSVKALDAQGVGTNFDVAKAIQYCADRADVRVINLSLGGPAPSAAIHDALLYATTPIGSFVAGGAFNGLAGKGKLVVVAAGNNNSQTETYPAGYSNDAEFAPNRILSVAATGDVIVVGQEANYSCRYDFSSYGDWVNISAPGFDIYSTTPWDIPFYENFYGAVNTRYDFMSGTSMAAAFVSAAAARRMGYKPLETSQQVSQAILDTGDPLNPSCAPLEMLQAERVNVARLMDRAGARVSVFDAATGVALNGASVSVNFLNSGIVSLRSSIIAPDTYKDTLGLELDPTRIFSYYYPVVDILDIPTVGTNGVAITSYDLKVNKLGYTAGYQPAFQQDPISSFTAGTFSVYTNGAVPPLSPYFNVVLGWHKWRQASPFLFQDALDANDLDLYVWLPAAPFVDPGQPDKFIVGYGGDAFTGAVADPYGTLNAFPFSRLKREGGFTDGGPTVESTTVLNRLAHAPVLANPALPYWAGTYTIMATDYGQVIDHDNDGCGDNFGPNFSPSYTGAECVGGDTPGIPLLGAYFTPYAYVWKDGVVKYFADGANNHGPWAAESACNKHWWKAFTITSPTAAVAPTYSTVFAPNASACGNGSEPNFIPYSGYTGNADRITVSGLGK